MEANKSKAAGRWKLFLVVLICASPMIASYLTYFVIKPQSRTNYGELIDPRSHPMPSLGSTSLDGKPTELEAYKGKWIMLQADSSDCAEKCRTKLFQQRQLRLTTGKEMERIERVWLVTDDKPVDTTLLREYDGTRVLRVDPAKLRQWLPVEEGAGIADHVYMIDPLGNLMMRFPKNPDPNKMKKDISKLLRASSIG
ncbi:cytochrome C oxidase subunit I|uniref:SCO family protein n=1 Tax=Noviherbaspirillum sp. L7-7A TaxID=2850560 RepID=UPI001C2BFBB7|nr:cytochrome C oxidase subunit I [Noviherbaspirillum sp. L7-7A]